MGGEGGREGGTGGFYLSTSDKPRQMIGMNISFKRAFCSHSWPMVFVDARQGCVKSFSLIK